MSLYKNSNFFGSWNLGEIALAGIGLASVFNAVSETLNKSDSCSQQVHYDDNQPVNVFKDSQANIGELIANEPAPTMEQLTELFHQFYANETVNFVKSVPGARKIFNMDTCVREEMLDFAQKRIDSVSKIRNQAAANMMFQYFKCEAVFLWLCANNRPFYSWKRTDITGITSPMELWADLMWEMFKIFHTPYSPLFKYDEQLTQEDRALLQSRTSEMEGFWEALMIDILDPCSCAVIEFLRNGFFDMICFKDMKISNVINKGLINFQDTAPDDLLASAAIRTMANERLAEIKQRFFVNSPATWQKYLSRFLRTVSSFKDFKVSDLDSAINQVFGGIKITFA